MRKSASVLWTTIQTLTLLFAGTPLNAQEPSPWLLDGRLGGGRPLGDLTDLRIRDEGVAFGLGVARPLSSRLTLKLDTDWLFLDADTAHSNGQGSSIGSDMRLVHVTAGADLLLTPTDWDWGVSVWAGGGFTVWAVDRFTVGATSGSFQHTYPVVAVGLSAAYAFSPRLSLYLGSRAYLAFAKPEDTWALAAITRPDDDVEEGGETQDADLISRAVSVPLVLGVRWDP